MDSTPALESLSFLCIMSTTKITPYTEINIKTITYFLRVPDGSKLLQNAELYS